MLNRRIATIALLTAAIARGAVAQGGVPAPVQLDTAGMFLAKYVSVGDNLFIGGQPTEKALRELRAKGVTVVVNLRTPEEMKTAVTFDEKALIEQLGMKYVHIPGRGGPPYPYAPEAVAKFTDAVKNANGKVLLHCTVAWRASHLWAAYLIKEKGIVVDSALANARAINLMDDHRMGPAGRQPVEDYLGRDLKEIKRGQ